MYIRSFLIYGQVEWQGQHEGSRSLIEVQVQIFFNRTGDLVFLIHISQKFYKIFLIHIQIDIATLYKHPLLLTILSKRQR